MSSIDPRDGRDGLTGATGAPGSTGASATDPRDGRDGLAGAPGAPGVRGGVGETGADGIHGLAGETGARGATGAPGPGSLRGSDRRVLFLLVAMLAIFALLAWRGEVNKTSIEHQAHIVAVTTWDQCQLTSAADARINVTTQAFIDLLGNINPQTPSLVAFAKFYKDSLLIVPVCGPKPK